MRFRCTYSLRVSRTRDRKTLPGRHLRAQATCRAQLNERKRKQSIVQHKGGMNRFAQPDESSYLPRPTAYRTGYTDGTLSAPSSGNARAPCHGRPNGRSPAAGSS